MIGSFNVTIRVKLDMDVTPEVAKKFIQEMNYEIEDTTGEVSIQDTEVIGDSIDEEVDDSKICDLMSKVGRV